MCKSTTHATLTSTVQASPHRFLWQEFHLTDVQNCIDGNASSYFLVQPQAFDQRMFCDGKLSGQNS